MILDPRLVTEFGMDSERRPLPRNAESPIVSSDGPKVTVEIRLFRKALDPIVTKSGPIMTEEIWLP